MKIHRLFLIAAFLFVLYPYSHAQFIAGGAKIPDKGTIPEVTIEVDFELPKGYVLKESVDLLPWFPPAGNQGRQYSCTAWAFGYGIMSYRFNRATNRTYGPKDTLDPAHAFSPAYLFNLMKHFSEETNCTSGLDMDKVPQFMRYSGCATLEAMPYDTAVNACEDPFNNTLFKEAIRKHAPPARKMIGFDSEHWKYHLSEGTPFAVVVAPTCEFLENGYDWNNDEPYIWDFKERYTSCLSHALVCVGYENDSTFTFRNSYGQEWGNNGNCQITYFALEQYCSGAYLIPNDTTPVWPALQARAMDRDTLRGATVHEHINENSFQVINNMRFVLDDIDHANRKASIHVYNSHSDSLLQSMVICLEQENVFYEQGQCITLELKLRRLFGFRLKRSGKLRVDVKNIEDDEHLQRIEKINARLRN